MVTALEPFDPWTLADRECTVAMGTCAFELRATNAMTMFYKQLFRVAATSDGVLHKYDNPNITFDSTEILTGDGYPKMVYVFNNTLPGRVLHVYRGQKVRVRIHNCLPTETLSVHFHGIRQYETPTSDGIGRVTQLLILPGSSFQHEFTVFDEGTYWYHSHVHSQTSMGLLGAFIVHPKLSPPIKIKEFVLMLQDWQHLYTGEQHQLLVESGQFYPNSVEPIMFSNTSSYMEAVDGSRLTQALVSSILINGRGQYVEPRNNESSSSPLERLIVEKTGLQYRVRLINGGSAFTLVFSIDEHSLQVIASDGVPFNQSIVVDRIAIGLGERYDVLVNMSTNASRTSWWIRADTLDKNNNPRWHGRAILQLGNDSVLNPTSSARNCSSQEPCRILNCPFSQYGSDSTYICLTMQDITTDSEHLDLTLLSDTTQVTMTRALSLTMVMSTLQDAGYESINYIGMLYPSLDKPILYDPQQAREKLPCPDAIHRMEMSETTGTTGTTGMPGMPGTTGTTGTTGMPGMPGTTGTTGTTGMPGMPGTTGTTGMPGISGTTGMTGMMGSKCYNNMVIQYGDIIEFLIINHDFDQHPMHLHGFSFHVIEQGLAQLNKTTGEFLANNPNVICNDDHINCVCVNCTINTRLVKDTVQLPKGGYIRIRFRANNPGVWLFHCHTESHLDRGMALMLHVAEDRIAQLLKLTGSAKNSGVGYSLFTVALFLSTTSSWIH